MPRTKFSSGWPCRLARSRTRDSHSRNTGSNPVGAAKLWKFGAWSSMEAEFDSMWRCHINNNPRVLLFFYVKILVMSPHKFLISHIKEHHHSFRFFFVFVVATVIVMGLNYLVFVSAPDSLIKTAVAQATGPLRVHSGNPRYFTDNSNRAIYLAGAYEIGFQDDAWGEQGEAMPFVLPSLDNMQNLNHNLLRLWIVEGTHHVAGDLSVRAHPMPYQRTSIPGATDGGNLFDLNSFDQEYFDRLRFVIREAGNRGIYVIVMLFEGFTGGDHDDVPSEPNDSWTGHPYNGGNNNNGINGDADGDGFGFENHSFPNPDTSPPIIDLQRAYVREVIDQTNAFDNVIYEIVNESRLESVNWQYGMIDYIHSYEATKPKQHPVLMSISWTWGVSIQDNAILFNSGAETISPYKDDPRGDYETDPPDSAGAKVVIADTDHINPFTDDPQYAWKQFTRGNNPSVLKAGVMLPRALTYPLFYADKMNLAAMTPRGDLTSTTYALANPGQEYLVYNPNPGSFTVNLPAGSYTVEWFNPACTSTNPPDCITNGGTISASGGDEPFTPPPAFNDSVLYLKVTGVSPPPPPGPPPPPSVTCPFGSNFDLGTYGTSCTLGTCWTQSCRTDFADSSIHGFSGWWGQCPIQDPVQLPGSVCQ